MIGGRGVLLGAINAHQCRFACYSTYPKNHGSSSEREIHELDSLEERKMRWKASTCSPIPRTYIHILARRLLSSASSVQGCQ